MTDPISRRSVVLGAAGAFVAPPLSATSVAGRDPDVALRTQEASWRASLTQIDDIRRELRSKRESLADWTPYGIHPAFHGPQVDLKRAPWVGTWFDQAGIDRPTFEELDREVERVYVTKAGDSAALRAAEEACIACYSDLNAAFARYEHAWTEQCGALEERLHELEMAEFDQQVLLFRTPVETASGLLAKLRILSGHRSSGFLYDVVRDVRHLAGLPGIADAEDAEEESYAKGPRAPRRSRSPARCDGLEHFATRGTREPDWRGGVVTESGYYVNPDCDPMCCRPSGPFPDRHSARVWAAANRSDW